MTKKYITTGRDEKQEFVAGSVRDSRKGKGRFDLIPTMPLRRLADLYERGAERYDDRNWEKGQPLMRYIDSAMRHLNCLVAGEPVEDHAAAVAWNMFGYMFTLGQIEAGKLPSELDDRPSPEPQYEKEDHPEPPTSAPYIYLCPSMIGERFCTLAYGHSGPCQYPKLGETNGS